MKRLSLWACLILACLVGTPASAETCQIEKKRVGRYTHYLSPYPIEAPPPGYDHDRYGTAPREIVREFAAFIASFDLGSDDDNGDGVFDILAQPSFVAYELRAYEIDEAGNYHEPLTWDRGKEWYTEGTDVFDFVREQTDVRRPRIDDSYDGIGTTWNRGHLAMKLHAERISHEAACNTHFFWNAVPQAASFNQGPWLDLEYWTGAAANKFGVVWVVAGPIFEYGEELQWIGDEGDIPVAVPSALFKIIARDAGPDTAPEVLAFVYPNASGHRHCATVRDPKDRAFGAYDHTPFLTTVATIEELTGLAFFSSLPDDQRQQVRVSKAEALWEIEPRYVGIICQPPQ